MFQEQLTTKYMRNSRVHRFDLLPYALSRPDFGSADGFTARRGCWVQGSTAFLLRVSGSGLGGS